ncbi:hypothetical protein TWF281_002856 [Arthrobotrys megalospora]
MARTKKDTAMQGPPHAGDPEPSDAHAGEHRRASARAPTVPFQMVTRRGAQKRTSGGSEEHAVASNDLASAGEEVYAEGAALPTPVGQGEIEPEPQGEGSGVVPTADDAGDVPRRSSRVVPKKVAPPVQRPRLILKLRLNPAKLESVMVPPATVPEQEAEGLDPSASRSTRLKLVVGDNSAKPSSPLLSPVSPMTEDQPVVPTTEGLARQKRPRKPKVASPNVEEANVEEEEERAPKRRRRLKKTADAAAGEEPILPPTAEPAAVQQLPPSPPVPAPTAPSMSPKPAAPVLAVAAPEAEPSLEPHQVEVSQPEEPLQKRRGRPPKSELLKRQRQPRQAAAPAPAGYPVGSLAHQFREQMPEGMNVLDVIALAQHMRAKDLLAKKRPMKRCIKRGYRAEHRVTREWCTQRNQKLVGQQRKLNRHLHRANIGLVDQAIRLAQTDPTYFSETGLGAPFYRAGLQQAAEHRDKLHQIDGVRRDYALQAVDDRMRHIELRRKRQTRNEIVDGLEKLAVERDHYSNIIRTFAAEHPDELDEIIDECEGTGEDLSAAILRAACEAQPNDVDEEVDNKIWRSRGHGLGKWFKFTDDNRMDLDEDEEPQAMPQREQSPMENEGTVSHEKQQPPMSFERGGSPGFDEREPIMFFEKGQSPVLREMEQPLMSNERGGSPMADEKEEVVLPMTIEEPQMSDERGESHINLTELLEAATQELQNNGELATEASLDAHSPGAEIEMLDLLASAAAEQDHLPGTPELLHPVSREPSLSKEPSPAFPKEPSPAFSEDDRIIATSASPPPSFGGDGSVDERASNFSSRMMESSAEPGFALSGPAPPPEVLKPSALYQETDHRSRFAGEPSRRWSDNRMFPIERNFSPIATHHHYLPGPSPPPLQSRGSSVHSLPPPTALSSPGRMLPSPVPSARFPAAYQALPQRSPSPGFFNPLPHDARYRGDQSR